MVQTFIFQVYFLKLYIHGTIEWDMEVSYPSFFDGTERKASKTKFNLIKTKFNLVLFSLS